MTKFVLFEKKKRENNTHCTLWSHVYKKGAICTPLSPRGENNSEQRVPNSFPQLWGTSSSNRSIWPAFFILVPLPSFLSRKKHKGKLWETEKCIHRSSIVPQFIFLSNSLTSILSRRTEACISDSLLPWQTHFSYGLPEGTTSFWGSIVILAVKILVAKMSFSFFFFFLWKFMNIRARSRHHFASLKTLQKVY